MLIGSSARRAGAIYGVWAALSLFVVACSLHYLRGVWLYEVDAGYERAAAAAELTEQALLRSAEGIGLVLDFAETRTELAHDGAIEAVAALDRRLQAIIEDNRFGIRGITSINPAGVIEWSPSGILVGSSVADREIFSQLMRDGAAHYAVSAPFISRASGRWIVAAGRSTHDAAGNVSALVVVGFDPMHLSHVLATVAGRPERVLNVRRLSDGLVRAASHDTAARLAGSPMPDHPVVTAARQAASGRLTYVSPTTGRPALAAFRALPSRNLVVYASFDRAAELAPYTRIARPVIAAAALYILASLIMAVAWDRNAQLRRSLHDLAALDPLTGLDNRRALEARMRHHDSQEFACLLFDVDHFKSINDRFGHARGDEVLQEIARVLRSEVRGSDIVCRWGGEEMLVVLRQCDRRQALLRADALRRAIEAMYDETHRVTASVGVACFPGDGETLAAITGLADDALYRAKRAGRNRVEMVNQK